MMWQKPELPDPIGCWVEECVGIPCIEDHVPISRGIEDVRLFYDATNDNVDMCKEVDIVDSVDKEVDIMDGDEAGDRNKKETNPFGIRFSGTTAEYCRSLKIMTGDYVITECADGSIRCAFCNGRVLESPNGDARRLEKNWIPVDKDQFIYQWCPMQIGNVLPLDPRLHILSEFSYTDLLPIMKKCRGSSTFTYDPRTETNIGVVHIAVDYSSRRHYYHLLVQLCPETHRPLAITSPFTFEGAAIEFCISFRILDKGDRFRFLVSKYDRDLYAMTIDRPAFLFIPFRRETMKGNHEGKPRFPFQTHPFEPILLNPSF
jgi:hypothetical protein